MCPPLLRSVNCYLLLYAYDSALVTSYKDPKVIVKSCRQWLIDSKLSFIHLGKTMNPFFLDHNTLLSRVDKLEVSCDGNIINPTNSVSNT